MAACGGGISDSSGLGAAIEPLEIPHPTPGLKLEEGKCSVEYFELEVGTQYHVQIHTDPHAVKTLDRKL